MQEFDYLIIGSGFGGSVAALRLAEKGYRVAVIEAGSAFRDQDFAKTNWNLRRFIFAPWLGLRGIMRINFFRGVSILSGAGVGGGSLVYANTLIKPRLGALRGPSWPRLSAVSDWAEALAAHYETARRMLGVTPAPVHFPADQLLKETATALGYGDTFSPVDVGVYFGKPGQTAADPYFGGEGPERSGCTMCGGCMVGCRNNAKNTLVKNYLYFAAKKGATIQADSEVIDVRPLPDGRYQVVIKRPGGFWSSRRHIAAKQVIFAAGVLGTVKLLLHCRDVAKTLPKLSPTLGHGVRTNSESILGVRVPSPRAPMSGGIAIAAGVHPDDHTSIEAVRYPAGSDAMGLLVMPLAGGRTPLERLLRVAFYALTHPLVVCRAWFPRGFAVESVIILVMQSLDSTMRFRLKRSLPWPFRKGLSGDFVGAARPPVLLPQGVAFVEKLAATTGGIAASSSSEVVGVPLTAHILGGCPMGETAADGVIDHAHRIHHYPGLFVLGGASVPANLGVNPSLTITAMAERAMTFIPPAKSSGA
ncbi:MAG: GMC family oxidoreductase [Proteobacteria bacterium]|nr:GMC family oxidoreductase [Pseudomonadota bacterium]